MKLLKGHVGNLTGEQFLTFIHWAMQNFINTCNWAALKAEISPMSATEANALIRNHYRLPWDEYEEFIKVTTPRTPHPHPFVRLVAHCTALHHTTRHYTTVRCTAPHPRFSRHTCIALHRPRSLTPC